MTDFKMNCSNFPCQANSAGWCPKCDQSTQGTVMLAAAPQQQSNIGNGHDDWARKHYDDSQQQAEPDTYGYALRFAIAIWEKHYKDISPHWKPFPDLLGVLTQIDNMTAGLTKPRITAEQVKRIKRLASLLETQVRSVYLLGDNAAERKEMVADVLETRADLHAALDALVTKETS